MYKQTDTNSPAYERQIRNAGIAARAAKITNRVRPLGKTPHGFYAPAAFMASAIAHGKRESFYRATVARLVAKALAPIGGDK